ncbi:MAG: glycosyltransferase family 4 protein [Phycisphaerae bacterium]|nr:glycosyltransferase family 4 protein [Phycisphaerae bacterium]
MNILLVNQFFPPDVAATGQLLADLADGLVRRGHEVHVLCSQRAYGGGGEMFPAESSRNGAHVHRVSATGFGRSGFVGRIVDYLSFYILATRRAMRLGRMDACVCLTTPPFIALVGCLLRRRRRTKLILWTMDLYPEIAAALGALKANSRLYRRLADVARRVYQAADAVISLGEVMTDRLRHAGARKDRISTVHNWVPGESVSYHPSKDSSTVTLLYSGNLGLGHELETALQAVAKLTDAKNLRVRFVGNGKLRARLQTMVQEMKLTNVEFAPPCPLSELSANLASGDIHLVSQRPGTEGLLVPSKLYGVLAAGRAVLYIGPDDTEAARIVRQSGAGQCVPPGDAAGAADALREMLADADARRRMGAAAREYYESHFGRDRSVGRIIDAVEATVCPGREAVA